MVVDSGGRAGTLRSEEEINRDHVVSLSLLFTLLSSLASGSLSYQSSVNRRASPGGGGCREKESDRADYR